MSVSVNKITVFLSKNGGILYGKQDISKCYVALIRSLGHGSLEEILFRTGVLRLLEKAGVQIINAADTVATSANKLLASAFFKETGLQVPETFATLDIKSALDKFTELNLQIVIKPIFGSLGNGVTRTGDVELAGRAFEFLRQIRAVPLGQEYVHAPDGDARVLIVGENVLGAISRRGDSWKSNIAKGGKAKQIQISSEVEKTARLATKAIGAKIAGVDVICSEKGIYVLEVNTQPGFREFSRVTGVNVAREIAKYAISVGRR